MPLPESRVIELFGDPYPFVTRGGNVSPSWPAEILAAWELPAPIALSWGPAGGLVRHLTCHRRVLPFFRVAFGQLWALGLWHLLKDFEGCYAWRPKRGELSLSAHAWGIAVDLNAVDNKLGATPRMDARIVDVFTGCGFEWGGTWPRRPDGMHFEFVDAARLTGAGAV